jgi:hypothetical protein
MSEKNNLILKHRHNVVTQFSKDDRGYTDKLIAILSEKLDMFSAFLHKWARP